MLKYKENLCTNMTVYDCKVIHLLQPAYEKKINHLDGCSTVGLYVEEWIGWELQILIMFQSIVILIYDSIPPFRASSVQQNCVTVQQPACKNQGFMTQVTTGHQSHTSRN